MGSKCNQVKIGAWNIHGLGKKLKDDDIVDSVNTLDFVAFVETWTSVQSNVNFAGYGRFHKIRQKRRVKGRPHGGILFLYKSKYKGLIDLVECDHEDVLIVKVKASALGHSCDLYIFVVYIAPGLSSENIGERYEYLEQCLVQYSGHGDTLLIGDFNSRTASLSDCIDVSDNDVHTYTNLDTSNEDIPDRKNCDATVNCYGRKLIELCQSSQHLILNGRFLGDSMGYFTYMSKNGCSVVDYFLANVTLFKLVEYFRVTPHSHLSDHCLLDVCLTFKGTPSCDADSGDDLLPLYDRLQANSECRESYIMSLLSEQSQDKLVEFQTKHYSNSAADISLAVGDFTSILVDAGIGSFRLKRGKHLSKKRTKNSKAWFDSQCHFLRREVRSTKRRVLANPYCDQTKQYYLDVCRKYKRLLKTKQKEAKDQLVNKLVQLADVNPNAFWKTLSSLQNIDGGEATTSSGISPKEWFNHFSKLGSIKYKHGQIHDDLMNELEELERREKTPPTLLNRPITISEVKRVCKNLKNNKASSDDMTINEMLKYGAEIILPAVTKLFNTVLKAGIFPKQWNTTYQVPLHKGGDPINCDNYRGISITSCLGKAFSSVLSERLSSYLDENDALSNFQAAFRKNHGTLDHIFTLKALINKYVKQFKSKIFACFVDFRKAFDTVWREGMFLKLQRLGIHGHFYELIRNMYSNTQSSVKLAHGRTQMFDICNGIKQGDCLSPTLFNIFIDDVGEALQSVGFDALTLNETRVDCLLYADDLVILSKSPLGLQAALGKLGTFCHTWKLEVNTKKTKIVVFRPSKKLDDVTFTFGKHNIEVVEEIVYLGISWSYSGDFKVAIKKLKIKAMRAYFKVISSLKSQSILTFKLQSKLFDSIVKPIMLYGSQVWGQQLINNILKQDLGQLDKLPFEELHNKLCKYSLGVGKFASNMACRAELGRYPLLITICALSVRLWNSILKSPSKLLYCAYQEELKFSRRGQKNWAFFIQNILERCHLHDAWSKQNDDINDNLDKHVRCTLEKQYSEVFFSRLNSDTGTDGKSGNKLRTYRLIKQQYQIEPYLTANISFRHAQVIAKLRLSAHNLAIETGRRARPPIPAGRRFCKFCTGQVEDELHFLINCPKYNQGRQQLFSICNLNYGTDSELFYTLLCSTEANILFQLGNFIYNSLELRDTG